MIPGTGSPQRILSLDRPFRWVSAPTQPTHFGALSWYIEAADRRFPICVLVSTAAMSCSGTVGRITADNHGSARKRRNASQRGSVNACIGTSTPPANGSMKLNER